MPVIASEGHHVEVLKFTMYDIGTNQVVESRRWATRDFIARFGGVLRGAGVMVEADRVDAYGMADVDFDPEARPGGFPTQVR